MSLACWFLKFLDSFDLFLDCTSYGCCLYYVSPICGVKFPGTLCCPLAVVFRDCSSPASV